MSGHDKWYWSIVVGVSLWIFIIFADVDGATIGFVVLLAWIILPVGVYKDSANLSTNWPRHRYLYVMVSAVPFFGIIGGLAYLLSHPHNSTLKHTTPRNIIFSGAVCWIIFVIVHDSLNQALTSLLILVAWFGVPLGIHLDTQGSSWSVSRAAYIVFSGIPLLGGLVGLIYLWEKASNDTEIPASSHEDQSEDSGFDESQMMEDNTEIENNQSSKPATFANLSFIDERKYEQFLRSGYETEEDFRLASIDELSEIEGMGKARAARLKHEVDQVYSKTPVSSDISEKSVDQEDVQHSFAEENSCISLVNDTQVFGPLLYMKGELESGVEAEIISVDLDQADDELIEKFNFRRNFWANLSDNSTVSTVYVEGERPAPWLAYDGGDMSLSECYKDIELSNLFPVLLDVAEAIRLCELYNQMHGTLGLENIRLVEEDDDVFRGIVVDWGISRIRPHISSPSAFTAPEQLLGEDSIRTDTYRFGCVIYAVLTGFPPHSEASDLESAIKRNDIPPPSSVVDHVPQAVDTILLESLDSDPSSRPNSPVQMISDIYELLN